jgi:hypothetical protein
MSPRPRRTTLARPTEVSATAAIFAAGTAALALMLTSATQFAGLSVGIQFAYVAFAASVGLLAFAAHLLIAERWHLMWLLAAAVLLAAASAYDVAFASAVSPVTIAVRALRHSSPALAVLGPFAFGTVLVWRAVAAAESLPLEMIGRGSDVADRGAVALLGNDLRTLLMLQRSLGSHTWRARPRVRIRPRFARRYPVLARALRGIARWRVYRWVFVGAVSVAVGALLRIHPANIRTIGLAAAALWALGLAVCEPIAQEHDRTNRLNLLPMSRRLEVRHVAVSWSLIFGWMLALLAIALAGRADAVSVAGVAFAAATGATTAAAISFRHVWDPMLGKPAQVAFPETAAMGLLTTVLWPGLVVAICLAGWATHARGLGVAAPSIFVLAGLVFWIRTGGVADFLRPVTPAWLQSTR